MAQVAQARLLPIALAVQSRVGFGCALVGVVAAVLPLEVARAARPPGVRSFGVGASFGRKLAWLAQASMSVPSTEKCSSESSPASFAWRSTAAKKRYATSPLRRRSRFLVKTVGSQIGSSAPSPTN